MLLWCSLYYVTFNNNVVSNIIIMYVMSFINDGSFYFGLPVEDGEFLFLCSQSLLKVFMFLQKLLYRVN